MKTKKKGNEKEPSLNKNKDSEYLLLKRNRRNARKTIFAYHHPKKISSEEDAGTDRKKREGKISQRQNFPIFLPVCKNFFSFIIFYNNLWSYNVPKDSNI